MPKSPSESESAARKVHGRSAHTLGEERIDGFFLFLERVPAEFCPDQTGRLCGG
jgi:hypothetical protein